MKFIATMRNTVVGMLDDALSKNTISQREYAAFFMRLKGLELGQTMSKDQMAFAAMVISDISKEFTMLMEQRAKARRLEQIRARVELKDINEHLKAFA